MPNTELPSTDRPEAAIGDARQPEPVSLFEQMSEPVLHGTSAAGWHDRVAKPVIRAGEMPEPEQRSVVVTYDDPRVTIGPRRFAIACVSKGWRVRITYARGPVATEMHQCPVCLVSVRINKDGKLRRHKDGDTYCPSGRPVPGTAGYKTVDSVMVYATKDGRGVALAEWVDKRADLCAITTNDGRPDGPWRIIIVDTLDKVETFLYTADAFSK